MAYIILSQAKDFKSKYDDVIFELYHFPAKYRSSINSGDIFIYHQGKQSANCNVRYYYGTGVVEDIFSKDNGKTFYAKLNQCKIFYNNVPIKLENGEYIEQLGFKAIRFRPNWESSIRKLSDESYSTIINMAGGLISLSSNWEIEVTKSRLKDAIDLFYLQNKKEALIDVVIYSSQLIKNYGNQIK